jgi:hypothetical protein
MVIKNKKIKHAPKRKYKKKDKKYVKHGNKRIDININVGQYQRVGKRGQTRAARQPRATNM